MTYRVINKVSAEPFVTILGDLWRRGETFQRMSEVSGVSEDTIRRLVFGEQHYVWQATAEKLRRVVELLPSESGGA